MKYIKSNRDIYLHKECKVRVMALKSLQAGIQCKHQQEKRQSTSLVKLDDF